MSLSARQADELGQSPVAVERSSFDERGILSAPSQRDIALYERRVEHVLVQLAVQKGIAEQAGQAHVRDLIPQLDLESGADNSGLENQWVQDTLTADQLNETYTIDHGNGGANGRAEGKIVAFYAVSNVATTPSTTELRFNTAQGGVFEILQTEGLLTDEEVIGLINDPIISAGNEQNYSVEQYVTATSDNLVLHGKTVEPRGTEMEPASENFLSGVGPGVSPARRTGGTQG